MCANLGRRPAKSATPSQGVVPTPAPSIPKKLPRVGANSTPVTNIPHPMTLRSSVTKGPTAVTSAPTAAPAAAHATAATVATAAAPTTACLSTVVSTGASTAAPTAAAAGPATDAPKRNYRDP